LEVDLSKAIATPFALSVAALFVACQKEKPPEPGPSPSTELGASMPTPKNASEVQCLGVNECKGKSACHTAEHGCAGQNACKGKGWIFASKEDCAAKGGKVM
jgi:hypothetical protein